MDATEQRVWNLWILVIELGRIWFQYMDVKQGSCVFSAYLQVFILDYEEFIPRVQKQWVGLHAELYSSASLNSGSDAKYAYNG